MLSRPTYIAANISAQTKVLAPTEVSGVTKLSRPTDIADEGTRRRRYSPRRWTRPRMVFLACRCSRHVVFSLVVHRTVVRGPRCQIPKDFPDYARPSMHGPEYPILFVRLVRYHLKVHPMLF